MPEVECARVPPLVIQAVTMQVRTHARLQVEDYSMRRARMPTYAKYSNGISFSKKAFREQLIGGMISLGTDTDLKIVEGLAQFYSAKRSRGDSWAALTHLNVVIYSVPGLHRVSVVDQTQ
jgi:hypothetical protein